MLMIQLQRPEKMQKFFVEEYGKVLEILRKILTGMQFYEGKKMWEMAFILHFV